AKAEAAAEVKLQNPRATLEQKNFPASAAIDANETSGWGIEPETGKDQAAVFDLAEPMTDNGEVTLSFELNFKKNKQQTLGRFRLSVATAQPLTVQAGGGTPESVIRVLASAADKRSAKDITALLAWYRHRDAQWQKLDAPRAEHAKQEPQPKLIKVMV